MHLDLKDRYQEIMRKDNSLNSLKRSLPSLDITMHNYFVSIKCLKKLARFARLINLNHIKCNFIPVKNHKFGVFPPLLWKVWRTIHVRFIGVEEEQCFGWVKVHFTYLKSLLYCYSFTWICVNWKTTTTCVSQDWLFTLHGRYGPYDVNA